MFACIVLLYFDEILLCMRTDLDDVLCSYMTFDLLPRTTVFL